MFLAQLSVLLLITVGRSVADEIFLRKILRKRGALYLGNRSYGQRFLVFLLQEILDHLI